MKQKLLKVSGSFASLDSSLSLQIPVEGEEAALRLYDKGMTIAIWSTVPDPLTDESMVTRTFMYISTDELPDNFLKYIGSTANGHIIEVTA